MIDSDSVNEWLRHYVEAWRGYDRQQIGELFTDDARYRYHPYDQPIRGREAIVESWFDEPDERGTYGAEYQAVAVEGDVAVATGVSTYTDAEGEVDSVYDNCFVIRFDGDGRCADFVEWYMKHPDA